MALKLPKGAQDTKTFLRAHPLGYPARNPPNPIPVGAFPVGSDFFTQKTEEQLQKLVDTTWNNRKKLDFNGTNATVTAAKAFLEKASSTTKTNVTVRWGLHQHDDRPTGEGKQRHFTVAATPGDWHLYINTNGSRLGYMSNGPAAANLVEITKP